MNFNKLDTNSTNLQDKLNNLLQHGELALTEETEVKNTTTDYELIGDIFDDCVADNFTYAAGVLTYIGEHEREFLMGGSTDLEVKDVLSTDLTISLALYKNDVLQGFTPHTFTKKSVTETMALTKNVVLKKNDAITIKSKIGDATKTLIFKTLNVTLW